MTCKLVEELTGTFGREELRRQLQPIAWSGTVHLDSQREQEAELHTAIRTALTALDECPDAEEVELEHGEVVAVIMADTSEEA